MKNKNDFLNCYALFFTILLIFDGCSTGDYFGEDLELPEVTTGSAFANATSAWCQVSLQFTPGNEYPVDYGIYWSNYNKIPADSDCREQSVTGATGNYSFYLYMLTPGTTYHFRAYASNGAGTGYGNVLTFTTTGSVTGEINFNPDLNYGSLTDIDGNIYKTIVIGTQTWMTENLKTTKYHDSEDIPQIIEPTDWNDLSAPGFCYYLNDPGKYKNIYGALYNWHAVKTGKLCPAGWHVPADTEWSTLTTFLGGESIAGSKSMETDTMHWIFSSPEITNSSGFTALPGGWRFSSGGNFSELGYEGYFWSSTDYYDTSYDYYGAWMRTMYAGTEGCGRGYANKAMGYSVRCVKD